MQMKDLRGREHKKKVGGAGKNYSASLIMVTDDRSMGKKSTFSEYSPQNWDEGGVAKWREKRSI